MSQNHSVAKVQLGEADTGIVYTSDVVAAPELKTIEIPSKLNVLAQCPLPATTKSINADLVKAFIEYILWSDGPSVLQNEDLLLPNKLF
jgi:molybdate transport system substrate-binding protein